MVRIFDHFEIGILESFSVGQLVRKLLLNVTLNVIQVLVGEHLLS